jgi:secreted trypsin-like serine protease
VPLNKQGNRITGGSTAARGQFPWQVALTIDNSWFCGGSLISSRWVLTAAHCTGSTYQLLLGASQLDIVEGGSQLFESATSIIHSQYDANTVNNDIAVIRLPSEVTFSTYISPVKLPPSNLEDLVNQLVIATGWGKITDGASGLTPFLQYVALTVISNEECANAYGNIITSTKICTATTGGKSTCNGDTGGPLLFAFNGDYNQVGIVSFGAADGCELEYPVGFTRVTSYLDWIESSTGISLQL